MSNGTIERYPQFTTGTVGLLADGTVWEPPATPPPTIEGYPPISTMGVAIDPDGVVWQYAPTQPGGIVEVTPPPPPPANVTPPTIQIVSGNPVPGQTAINSNPGSWDPPQTGGYRRQWRSSGAAIGGATANNYVIQASDVGNVLTCGVIAVGDGGPSDEVQSNGLPVIAAPPTNTVPPNVSGTPEVGQVLTRTTGTWTGSPTLTTQWYSAGAPISGATGATYTAQVSDVGNTIAVIVTGTNAGGSLGSGSNSVGPIIDPAADEPAQRAPARKAPAKTRRKR